MMALHELSNAEHESSTFGSLLIAGTLEDANGHVRHAQEGEIAELWSAYGRDRDGLIEWIADFDREIHALFFAASLARVLDIPVEGGDLNYLAVETSIHFLNNKGVPN